MSRRLKGRSELFWEKVDKYKPGTQCWLWTASKNEKGYGYFGRGKWRRAHRAAWLLVKGEIPPGMMVCHRCDNPSCVNPDHLYLGTQHDNSRDQGMRERHNNAKLSYKQWRQLLKLWDTGQYTQKELGKVFGLNQQNVSECVRRRSYKHYQGRLRLEQKKKAG